MGVRIQKLTTRPRPGTPVRKHPGATAPLVLRLVRRGSRRWLPGACGWTLRQ